MSLATLLPPALFCDSSLKSRIHHQTHLSCSPRVEVSIASWMAMRKSFAFPVPCACPSPDDCLPSWCLCFSRFLVPSTTFDLFFPFSNAFEQSYKQDVSPPPLLPSDNSPRRVLVMTSSTLFLASIQPFHILPPSPSGYGNKLDVRRFISWSPLPRSLFLRTSGHPIRLSTLEIRSGPLN